MSDEHDDSRTRKPSVDEIIRRVQKELPPAPPVSQNEQDGQPAFPPMWNNYNKQRKTGSVG